MSGTILADRPARRTERAAPERARRPTPGRERQSASGRAVRPAHPARDHRVLLWSITGLSLIGLPIVLSASSVDDAMAGSSPYSDFIRQAIFLSVAALAALVASRIKPEVIRRFRFTLPVAALSLLVLVFLPGLGHNAGGSSRWIGVGPIQIQPSEIMKLAVIVFAADLLARRAHRRDHWRAVVTPLLVLLAVGGMLIMKQPDLGTTIVIACVTFAMMFAAGIPVRTLSAAFVLVAVPAAYETLHSSYQRARLSSLVDPLAHASGSGYQVVQSLATLGMGGLRGSGIGSSASTWGFLPNAHTDFVFAVVGGNLGLLGSLAVLVGFAAFGWAGIRVAARERDPFTRYLAIGITCWICCQAVINVGGVVDALPVTGIPLPFISYGGSALVVAMTGAGVLLGIARRQRRAVEGP